MGCKLREKKYYSISPKFVSFFSLRPWREEGQLVVYNIPLAAQVKVEDPVLILSHFYGGQQSYSRCRRELFWWLLCLSNASEATEECKEILR
jgi:hypothetical protein